MLKYVKMAQKGLFLPLFLLLGLQTYADEIKPIKSPKTGFTLVEDWLEFPGLNADLTFGYEFLSYHDFGRGFSTQFLTIGKCVEFRYGYSKGLSTDWSTHELGLAVKVNDLKRLLDFEVPGILQSAGIGLSYGPNFLNNGVETLKLNAVLIGFKY